MYVPWSQTVKATRVHRITPLQNHHYTQSNIAPQVTFSIEKLTITPPPAITINKNHNQHSYSQHEKYVAAEIYHKQWSHTETTNTTSPAQNRSQFKATTHMQHTILETNITTFTSLNSHTHKHITPHHHNTKHTQRENNTNQHSTITHKTHTHYIYIISRIYISPQNSKHTHTTTTTTLRLVNDLNMHARTK